MTNAANTTTEIEVLNRLADEGHDRGDIEALINQMIETGLELDQPDQGWRFTPAEVDVIREQLTAQ